MGHGIVKCIKFIWDCVLSVIYCDDQKCAACGREIFDEGAVLCPECRKNVSICRDSVEISYRNEKLCCYSAAYYSGTMMQLIIKLKYKSSFRAGKVIADYMYRTIKFNNIHFEAITYVPMMSKDIKKRGYNQAEYIARILGDYTKRPVLSCLIKVKNTKDQIGLSKGDRWRNIDGSFEVVLKKLVCNKNILLVDDVLTTGATVFFSALELKKSGAQKIVVLTGAKSKV